MGKLKRILSKYYPARPRAALLSNEGIGLVHRLIEESGGVKKRYSER